jgi:Uma2 family endonuclease
MALSAQTPTHQSATLEEFLAIPPHERFHEILDGEIVRKVMPSGRHGVAQRRLSALLDPYDGDQQSGRPGGWWIMSEVEVQLARAQVIRPDLVGWRNERMREVPEEFPIKLRPDWVCEIVSPSDPRRDTVIKVRDYARAGIPHYWLVDLQQRLVTSLKLQDEHYGIQAEGRPGDLLRAEPFELIELAVASLFPSGSAPKSG